MTLVVGPEDLLADRAVAGVIQAARAQVAATVGGADAGTDLDVRRLAAPGLAPGTVTDLTAPSLFEDRKVVVVTGLQEAAEELVAELKGLVVAVPDDLHLVLVHRGGPRGKGLLDAARKAGAVEVKCAEVKWDSDKLTFVNAEFRREGRRVTPGAARALVEAVGSDLRELASSCSQLVADIEGTVDEAAVDRYHGGRVEVSGFKVADRTVEGRTEEALALLRHAMATGVAPVLVTSALATGLRTLVKVGSAGRGARSGDLARELGLAPFMVDKARRQLPGWTPDGLDLAIRAVAQADADVKGAAADPVYALERAVVTVANARAAG